MYELHSGDLKGMIRGVNLCNVQGLKPKGRSIHVIVFVILETLSDVVGSVVRGLCLSTYSTGNGRSSNLRHFPLCVVCTCVCVCGLSTRVVVVCTLWCVLGSLPASIGTSGSRSSKPSISKSLLWYRSDLGLPTLTHPLTVRLSFSPCTQELSLIGHFFMLVSLSPPMIPLAFYEVGRLRVSCCSVPLLRPPCVHNKPLGPLRPLPATVTQEDLVGW